MVTSVSRDNFDIIVVVLGADTKKIRTRDSIKLIEYTYKNYELCDLQKIVEEEFLKWKEINEGRIKIYKGTDERIETVLGKLKYAKYPIEKNKLNDIWVDINFKDYFEAPVEENKKIGNVKIGLNSTGIMSVEILNSKIVYRKNIINYFIYLLSKAFL